MLRRHFQAMTIMGMLLAGSAHAGTLEVGAGQSMLLRLDRAAASVIIGDPSVADVTVEAPNLLAVFGKRAGGTSLTILDGAKRPLMESQVLVQPAAPGGVTITYAAGKSIKPGGQTMSYACGSSCIRVAEKEGAAAAPAPAPAPAAAAK